MYSINDEDDFFPYCDEYKYLGSIFTPLLKDNDDIQKRISQVCGMFAPMKGVLCNLKIYQPTIEFGYTTQLLSIFFYDRECKSWALTEELQRKLEVCHHRFLRRMVDVNHNLYDVNDHHISNEQVRREELGNCCSIFHQSL